MISYRLVYGASNLDVDDQHCNTKRICIGNIFLLILCYKQDICLLMRLLLLSTWGMLFFCFMTFGVVGSVRLLLHERQIKIETVNKKKPYRLAIVLRRFA